MSNFMLLGRLGEGRQPCTWLIPGAGLLRKDMIMTIEFKFNIGDILMVVGSVTRTGVSWMNTDQRWRVVRRLVVEDATGVGVGYTCRGICSDGCCTTTVTNFDEHELVKSEPFQLRPEK
jgi:hypothetical protein